MPQYMEYCDVIILYQLYQWKKFLMTFVLCLSESIHFRLYQIIHNIK